MYERSDFRGVFGVIQGIGCQPKMMHQIGNVAGEVDPVMNKAALYLEPLGRMRRKNMKSMGTGKQFLASVQQK